MKDYLSRGTDSNIQYGKLRWTSAKRSTFVNSYHRGYAWSDKIEATMEKALNQSDIQYNLKIFRMDSKNNKSDAFIREKAEEAYKEIEAWEPDIILGQ